MTIKEQITHDMKEAMKAKDNDTRDTLRLLAAAIKQVEVDEQKELDDAAVQAILLKQAKQRRESIDEYEKAGRGELAKAEKTELAIIENYLPIMMDEAEIRALAEKVIAEVGATDVKSMGMVMGKLMPQVKGKADGKLVNQVVQDLLKD